MKIDAAHRDLELRKGVEPRLLRPPVEGGLPVFRDLSHVAEIGPKRPRLARRLVGKAGARETLAQIVDRGLRHIKRERRRIYRHDGLRVVVRGARSDARPAVTRNAVGSRHPNPVGTAQTSALFIGGT
jgi:hypothetical protein